MSLAFKTYQPTRWYTMQLCTCQACAVRKSTPLVVISGEGPSSFTRWRYIFERVIYPGQGGLGLPHECA